MRSCGVFMHITSLPGRGGVGSLGLEARSFVDFLSRAGQSWWQVLPLTPPARGNSPYSAYSVFAGNPALISLELLEQEGLLAPWTRRFTPLHKTSRANFEYCHKIHLPLLRHAFKAGGQKKRDEIQAFREKHAAWLEDYALFMALRGTQDAGVPFHDWPPELRGRDLPEGLREQLEDEIDFWVWTQYQFFRQWLSLKQYANDKGIGLIGDMPLYPDRDSADVWANPQVFQLDADGSPLRVAGCPPDDFTEDGQLWGNPLYNWEALEKDGYRWWLRRLGLAAEIYDMVRLDHFRGLDEYYAIPADAKTAREGEWRPGPGMKLIDAVREQIPNCRLIAEDLGVMTGTVRKLLADSGLPGMKVMQFGFDPNADSEHLPHNYTRNSVVYTGTHDNDTVMGWIQSAGPEQWRFARDYLRLSRREGYHWGFVRGLYASCADTVIVPVQDLLGLGAKARMNIPGVAEGNWGWRLSGSMLTDHTAAQLRGLAQLYRR